MRRKRMGEEEGAKDILYLFLVVLNRVTSSRVDNTNSQPKPSDVCSAELLPSNRNNYAEKCIHFFLCGML